MDKKTKGDKYDIDYRKVLYSGYNPTYAELKAAMIAEKRAEEYENFYIGSEKNEY